LHLALGVVQCVKSLGHGLLTGNAFSMLGIELVEKYLECESDLKTAMFRQTR